VLKRKRGLAAGVQKAKGSSCIFFGNAAAAATTEQWRDATPRC